MKLAHMLAVTTFAAVAISATQYKLRLSELPDFKGLNTKQASAIADTIVADRIATEKSLTSQFDEPELPADQKVLLIYTLGELRSTWAVSSLVAQIDFRAPWSDPKDDIARWGPYPAVDALTNIGIPSIREIVRVLPTETVPLHVHLQMIVVHQVAGAGPGRAYLELAAAAAQGENQKRNVQKALADFDALVAQADGK